MRYTLKGLDGTAREEDRQRADLKEIFDSLTASLKERELQAKVTLGSTHAEESIADMRSNGAPDNIWTLGRAMWEDGTDHLPWKWVNETVPKVLNLNIVPTINCYKALMRQVQGGLVSGMPGFEFLYDDYEAAQKLDAEWRKFAARSRLLGEIDSLDEDCLNYGIGYLGFTLRGRELCGVSIDPRMVLWLPVDAARYQDIDAIFKIYTVYVGPNRIKEHGILPLLDKSRGDWPVFFSERAYAEEYDIRVEFWVRPGGKIGSLEFPDEGLHAEISSDNKVLFEEPYNIDRVPILPVTLSPTKYMIGHAMSSELWQSQVRIDKFLAKLLWCVQYAGADKWRIDTSLVSKTQEGAVPALNMTAAASPMNQLRNGGIGIVLGSQGQVEKFEAEMSQQQLHAEYEAAKRDMEYLAGISQPYQGLEPARVTAGVAINALVRESSKRIQRMGTFLAEGLREYAMTWAKFMLASWGYSDLNVDVIVSLIPQEENTKRQQVETLKEIADMVVKFTSVSPAMLGMMDLLVDMIPGLTLSQKTKLKEIIAQLEEQAAAEQAASEQEQLPEGLGGAVPPASEEPVFELSEQDMTEPMMEQPAGAEMPLPNAPAVVT